jgi:hypothetical protein
VPLWDGADLSHVRERARAERGAPIARSVGGSVAAHDGNIVSVRPPSEGLSGLALSARVRTSPVGSRWMVMSNSQVLVRSPRTRSRRHRNGRGTSPLMGGRRWRHTVSAVGN